MATAGSVVIDLLMRTGSFETDSKRAEKRIRELEKTAKQFGAVMGTAIATGAGLAVAAINSSINRMDELSKAALRVGVSTESFSALAYAGELADVSIGDLQSSMGKLVKSQAEALKQNSQHSRIFKALGIEVADASGKLREADAVFADFADAFQRQQGSPEIMAAGLQIFGRSFQNLIPLIKDGSQGLRDASEEARAFGQIISTETGQAAEAFNDNLTRLKSLASGLANAVAAELLPDMRQLTDEWVRSAKEGDKLTQTAREIADAIRFLGVEADKGSKVGEAFKVSLQGWTTQALAFKDVLFGIATADLGRVTRAMEEWSRGGIQAAGAALFGVPEQDSRPTGPARNVRGGSRRTETGGANPFFQSSAQDEALRAALGDSPKRGSSGKSKREPYSLADSLIADREALAKLLEEEERARTQFEAWAAQLSGPVADANYRYARDLEELNELAAKGAIGTDELSRAQEDLRKEHERNVEEIQARLESGKLLLEDLQFELELMKLGNAERATAIQLRGLEADQIAKYGDEIAEANRKIMENAEQADFMDGWRGEFQDFFSDVLTGTKSIGDAFEDMLSNIGAMIANRIAQNWVDQLFGEMGTTNGGAAGGGNGGWFQAVAAAFSGSRAGGGDVLWDRAHLVGEQGPEMFVPRTAGTIIPNNDLSARRRKSEVSVSQYFYNPVMADQRSDSQRQQEAARKLRMATARNG